MTPAVVDAVIVGGGPAGATAATVLADHGRRVAVLERSAFPRHHVGESLMPQTYWTFQRLGLLEKLKAAPFVRKESVQFVSANGMESAPFFFSDRDPNEWSVTWQVHRGEFDKLMLDHARERGAEIVERANAREVLFEGDRAVGVRAVVDGQEREFRARVVVDATGQSTLLSRQLKLREPDEKLKNAAIYAHYRGAEREEGRNAGATIIIHTPDRRGWFWWIPLHDDIMSVGLVGPPGFVRRAGVDAAVVLDQEIVRCPAVSRRLARAVRVGPVHTESDFSYRSRRVAGDGWVLIGDAFGFLDPVYSSGVMLALKSGELAADAIHAALSADDPSAERLGAWGPTLAGGMQHVRRLVYAFYHPDFSIGRFVKANPQYQDHLVRVLIGDVFNDEVGEMFGAMGSSIELPPPIVLESDRAMA